LIKTIYLENFMAHKATTIELSPGVTVITGPNNIGKSAVVEAIRYLVYNPSPKNVIRHGAKKAVVRLELDSGEIITWQRQDKNASYTIQQPGQGPEAYHKFGRDVPDDVRSLLRLELVETDTGKLDIHLGNQREPIFLLDRPGSHAAGFFAASSEADYLLKMQQALKSRIDQANRDKKRLSQELTDLAKQLLGFEPLDDLAGQISQAEQLYGQILAIDRQLPLLAELISDLLGTLTQLHQEKRHVAVLRELENPPAQEEITGLTLLRSELEDKTGQHRQEAARSSSLAPLVSPPALSATAELEFLLRQSQATQTRQTTALAQAQVLAALTRPPVLLVVEPLQELVATYDETLPISTALRQRQTILALQAEPPQLEEPGSLEVLILQLQREQTRHDRLQHLARFLIKLPPIPETAALDDLEDSLGALWQAAVDLSSQQATLAALMVQLENQQAEIQAYLLETGFCPLCGSPMDMKHLLEGWHD
jgi:DNA repair exonuclease SbcCD ATPase subunit